MARKRILFVTTELLVLNGFGGGATVPQSPLDYEITGSSPTSLDSILGNLFDICALKK